MTAYGGFDRQLPGTLATFHNKFVMSFSAEALIEFGVPLRRGTDPEKQVDEWQDVITVPVVGISLSNAANVVDTPTAHDGYYVTARAVSVLQRGRVWVTTNVNVVAGDKAYVTAGSGAFTNIATNNLLVGSFQTSGLAGTTVVLEVNFNN